MKLWPSNLFGRLCCALMLAIVALIALSFAVEWLDAEPLPTKRATGALSAEVHAAEKAPVAAAKPVPIARPLSAAARASFEVARRLRPCRGTILCAHREASLAPDIAPVVEILASGELILRRPEPLASGPLPGAPVSGSGHGAGIVLPAHDLEKLTPAARGALVALLRRWCPERPIPLQKLRSSDVLMAPAAVRRLLSWAL